MKRDTEPESSIAKAKSGDRDALQQILAPLQKPVFMFLRRFVNDADANDIAQETFILVVRKVGQFQFKSSFRAWVFRIAYRQMLNHQKSFNKKNHFSLDQQDIMSAEPSRESELEQDEQSQFILNVIDQLPDTQRQVVWLRVREQLTFKEIAEICEESINTILSRMHQAKKVLSRKLKAAGIDLGVPS